MITGKTMRWAGMALVIPSVLWLAGHAMGFGAFDKPPLPVGAKLGGTSAKGTMTYVVNPNIPAATVQFEGKCGSNTSVSTSPINVTTITDFAAFAGATDREVADRLEGFFTDVSSAVTPFLTCYKEGAYGIYIAAVNRSLIKTSTMWVGEVTILGVR